MLVGVTGGRGLIGSELVNRHLGEGDTVRVLTRSPSQDGKVQHQNLYYFAGDLTLSSPLLESFADGLDVLYHCAGELLDESEMPALHVGGTENLIAAASNRVKHWVQLSSVGVYGPVFSGIVTEDSPLNPQGTYETTKVKSDLLVKEAAEKRLFSLTVVRPANVYGPNMPNQSLFQLINMIDKGLFFFIGRPGASTCYIHVSDVADALLRCASNVEAKGQTFIVSEHQYLEDYVAGIARELGKPSPRMRLPKRPLVLLATLFDRVPGFPLSRNRINAMTSRTEYSTEKIHRELDYVTKISTEEGIRQMVAAWNRRRQENNHPLRS